MAVEGLFDELDRRLAAADTALAAEYPGDRGVRQPVHTVYVPADQMAARLPADWGAQARAALEKHAGSAAALAEGTGIDQALVDQVLPGVLAKRRRDASGPLPDTAADRTQPATCPHPPAG